MRRTWVLAVLGGLAVLATGCGSSTHTAAPAGSTATTVPGDALARFCADLNAPVPPIAVPGPGATDTGKAFRDQYAAGLPHWQAIQRDAPPRAAADVAPIVAAIEKVIALDPALSDTQTATAAGDIMNAPELRAALADLGAYASPICQGDSGQSTTATTG
jgi:hypothetical protein